MQMAVNARYKHRRVTGVERYAHEISLRLFPPMREIQPSFPLPPLFGHIWEQFILPVRLSQEEVLWSPANTGPWILRRHAVTIHDASVFDHPEWFKSTFGAWTRLSWKVLAKRARAILTVSNFSCKRLQHHLRIPASMIHVIPSGVGSPFEPTSARSIEAVREKYGLTNPYFLFVGTYQPRKNLSTLIEAWKISKLSENYILAIAGTEGKVFAPAGHALSVTCNMGYVPDADLPALYSDAVAVLMPSLYEGFGLTALEAMACGTPVIASNRTSFPEVVGDAGVLVDPNDATAIAEAMRRIVEDATLLESLQEQGLNRARQFSWDESARRIQALVESL